jgi:TolA-binding protein
VTGLIPEILAISAVFALRYLLTPLISGREIRDLIKYLKRNEETKQQIADLNTEVSQLKIENLKNKLKVYNKNEEIKMTREEFKKSADEFINKYVGKYLDYDKAYGNQCKDVFSAFNSEVVKNTKYIFGNAIELWNSIPQSIYDRIDNTPAAVPEQGDVIIWGKGIGQYGHCAIATGNGDVNSFESLDQNYPAGDPCHKQQHNYSAVLGWFRAKTDNNAPKSPQTPEKTKEDLTITQNLYPGLRNNEGVKKLQTKLKQLGYFPADIKPTGNYLKITIQAVTTYQIARAIVSNAGSYGAGYCGPRTREKLNKE